MAYRYKQANSYKAPFDPARCAAILPVMHLALFGRRRPDETFL